MGYYNIYAGLGGGFDGATFQGMMEFNSEEEAWQVAYQLAVEEYESYSGLHGLPGWQDIYDSPEYYGIENFDSLTEAEKEEAINNIIQEDCENWIEYYAEEVKE